MENGFRLIQPKCIPPLDEDFRPAVLANQAFREEAATANTPLVIALERDSGKITRYETLVFPEDHPRSPANLSYVERLVKFLLWQRGGHRVMIGGPGAIAEHIRRCYTADGPRHFDRRFMGDLVYEQPFTVESYRSKDIPPTQEVGEKLGRHLDGFRIGFDLGASDRKVSAVVDGRVVYSEEVIWEPRQHNDPSYHYTEIMQALKTAASKMEHLDAIGGSSAGVYINNRPMVASLFRGVPPERYAEIRDLFLRLQTELNVPLVVINDGEVAALAGSMSLGENGVLGIAFGSSQAAGYVDPEGFITGWLNELAFAPIDYNPTAPVDEWSGDQGCGSQYFSQQCVFRLAPRAGITLPNGIPDAEKLAYIQEKLEAGHEGAVSIWQTMGVYLGYALAHYADFYTIKHVLLLGRCTSGSGGALILEGAQNVLRQEFPELCHRFQIHLPDERSRRVGQSIAAASLPEITRVP